MNMESADLNASISAVSIVFGVLTYFLTMVYERTKVLLGQSTPAAEEVMARKRFRKELLTTLFLAVAPLLLAWSLLFYICLPTVIHIGRNSQFSPWNLELLSSLFVLLEAGIAVCSTLSLVLSLRVLAKWWNAR
jgi:hypothetical protein